MMRTGWRAVWAAGVLPLLLGGGAPRQQVGAGSNWDSHGGAADESGFSRLAQISSRNVSRLGLVWQLELPGEQTLEATPLAVGGMLYFTGSHAEVYAVDARSGALKWKYDPETWKVDPDRLAFTVFPVNRGVAYDNGRIFVGSLDGRLIALDAHTGAVQWSVKTLPERGYHTSTGAPRAWSDGKGGGKVIIGQGGADIGMRGFVTAYDQATGRQLWRFYTTPGTPEENGGDPAMERAAATWNGEWWKRGTGGTVWNGMTFDPELNRIYIGTGNGGPYDPAIRSPGNGDNLYLCSIVALDADTGKYVWHYQINPREGWDYKATAGMIATTLTIGGKRRKVLMQAPTNGFFYVLDRETGKPISAEKYGKVTWAERIDMATGRPVERPNIRFESGDITMYPGSSGAHNWQAMSYSPRTGLVYIPYMQLGTRFTKGAPKPGEIPVGGINMSWADPEDPEDGKGALVAWDPVRQRQAWRVQHQTLWNGGTLATSGGLVFQGAADGWLSAYDARSGRRLWRFQAGQGIIAAPVSYSVAGRQYVSVLAGYGSSAAAYSHLANTGWKYGVHPRRLLTFALDGKAALPREPGPIFEVKALDDPAIELAQADIEHGSELFHRCMGCHGRNAEGVGGPAADLRESPLAFDREALWSVVHDGALLSQGMPRFASLTREQVDQIWSYIRAEARKAAPRGK
ncbi:MAG: PQQ-dependent dehydrogenase, methanol/ethanol family [Novosphingobium sp.]